MIDTPKLLVNGKPILVVEPLKWYQIAWSGLALMLVFLGGAIGAIIGLIAFAANAKLFRSDLSPILQFLITGVITAVAIGFYLVIAILLRQVL